MAMLSNLLSIGASFIKYNLAFGKAIHYENCEILNQAGILTKAAAKAIYNNKLNKSEIIDVLTHGAHLVNKGCWSSLEKMTHYGYDVSGQAISAIYNTITNSNGEKFHEFAAREASVMESVSKLRNDVEAIKDEFGFHFNTKGYNLVHETDAFILYQILPTKPYVHINDDKKPVLLIPPYMLGANILSFLPGENKSYAHAFANEGIPTYVRIVKDIETVGRVRILTPEDDCVQLMELCTVIKHRHHDQKITLNGTCQGGYICLMNILSGHFVDIVDGLITNVTPIDGTYSQSIVGLPQLHSDFVTRTLSNGAKVADGYILSLGMRFAAIDKETPLIKVLNSASLYRTTNGNPGKTVAALFRWLTKERVHLPLAIANMSSCTFQKPILPDGTLPIKLFEHTLNIKDLKKYGVRWYQNYALKDDLVTPACATAGNKFLDDTVLESVPFPGGHVAILTSPYNPKSPVNDRFVVNGVKYRGPVAWQLEFGN